MEETVALGRKNLKKKWYDNFYFIERSCDHVRPLFI